MVVPLGLEKGMLDWYADLPQIVREAKYLSPHFNFSSKTCSRWDAVMSKCGVHTNSLVYEDGEWTFGEEVIKTLMNFPISDRDGWMDRSEMDDELMVDYVALLAAEQDVIDTKYRLAAIFAWDKMYSVPGKYADFIEYKCLTSYVWKKETLYAGCPFHSGYQVLKKVVELWEEDIISTEDAARMIGPYFLRNSSWLPPIPNDPALWRDYHLKSFTSGVNRHANAMMRKRMPENRAWAIAWDSAKKEHPEYEEFIANITRFTKEAIPNKNIKLKGTMKDRLLFAGNLKLDAVYGARAFFRAQGMDVPREEATKTYDWMVCGSGADKKASLLAGCPIVTSAPEGYYPTRIILQTAVTDRLQEVYEVDPKKPNKAWVRCVGVDMPAVEFNSLTRAERAEMLGCNCAHCVQKDIFLPRIDHKDKLIFRVASEVMLNPEAFDSIAGLLTELTELGVDAISYGEEDFLRENVRAIEYDMTEDIGDEVTRDELNDYEWDGAPTAEVWDHINWDALTARKDGLFDLHPAHEPQPVKIYIDKSVIRKEK